MNNRYIIGFHWLGEICEKKAEHKIYAQSGDDLWLLMKK
jgi:hypothetical protein